MTESQVMPAPKPEEDGEQTVPCVYVLPNVVRDEELLTLADDKRERKRFSGAGPTNFGSLTK